jgi:uncharacterized protein RhaS with RHS repeats
MDDEDLYYYRARYYDPTLQRFLSIDPIGFLSGDFNFYRYVGNNPNNFYDPYGLDIRSELCRALGGSQPEDNMHKDAYDDAQPLLNQIENAYAIGNLASLRAILVEAAMRLSKEQAKYITEKIKALEKSK